MSASVYISKNENESRAFTNHCDNHINFDTIAKICVGGQYNLKFPVAAKQNKINIKNKLDIKIPLNNKVILSANSLLITPAIPESVPSLITHVATNSTTFSLSIGYLLLILILIVF